MFSVHYSEHQGGVLVDHTPRFVLEFKVLITLFHQVLTPTGYTALCHQVGEWRGFLSMADREYIEQLGLNNLMYSAYLCTTLRYTNGLS